MFYNVPPRSSAHLSSLKIRMDRRKDYTKKIYSFKKSEKEYYCNLIDFYCKNITDF